MIKKSVGFVINWYYIHKVEALIFKLELFPHRKKKTITMKYSELMHVLLNYYKSCGILHPQPPFSLKFKA
jgi:hypothetical protein